MLIGVAVAGACGSTAFVPPPPSPQRVYGASEVDERPAIVQTPPLHYPEGGRRGVVVVRVVIDTAGNPEPATALVVQGSDSVLAAAARTLVLNTLFRAARVRGQVVRTLVEVPVEFAAAPMPAIKMHIAGDVYSEADVEARPHLISGPPALEDLSLDVRDGEFFVLLGPSGCGKTTALRCIAGLEEPSSGEVLIGGRDVTRLDPAARDVAMVFQTYALYPHLTVRGNVAFGLEVRRVPAAEIARRVQQVADRLGLGPLLDRRPAELSGGERQRVALGRALVREPQVFLLDEPLSNPEPTLRGELRADLLELHRALHTTVVYVTHDQIEAMTMGQRMAVLEGGRLRQVGTPAEVYGRPADVFVARFIGNPGMNILRGRARGAGEEGGIVDCGSWSVPVPLERYEGETYLGVRAET